MANYLKVLLVHTQPEVIQEVKDFLGHAVIQFAADGADGLFAGRMEEFDLVVCALDLPLITGLEVVRALRNMSPNNKTPVIFLGNGTETPQHLALISRLRGGYFLREELTAGDFLYEWNTAMAALEI